MKQKNTNGGRGVKPGTKRGKYKCGRRKMRPLYLSPSEDARLDLLRGGVNRSKFIRDSLGLSG